MVEPGTGFRGSERETVSIVWSVAREKSTGVELSSLDEDDGLLKSESESESLTTIKTVGSAGSGRPGVVAFSTGGALLLVLLC